MFVATGTGGARQALAQVGYPRYARRRQPGHLRTSNASSGECRGVTYEHVADHCSECHGHSAAVGRQRLRHALEFE